MRIVLALGIILGLTACQKKSDFLYYVNPQTVTTSQKIRELGNIGGKVDMLWVIGGMTEHQQEFHDGVDSFMKAFMQYKAIDWRMGVISTDPSYAPFLGMGGAGVFDTQTPNASQVLVDAVTNVLSSYDGEQVFDPIAKALTDHSDFIRTDAMLAIIMTNDAHDSSSKITQAADMLAFLKKVKGNLNQVLIYGIFGATDLGCSNIDEQWNYHGSPFEQVIMATGGQGLSLCSAQFGTLLAQIGDHLKSHIFHSRLYLAKRPVVSSIQITFHDKELPGGPADQGGYWLYNVNDNSIIFNNLDFATQDDDAVVLNYKEDVGIHQ